MKFRLCVVCATSILFAGCAAKDNSIYSWGSYQQQLYTAQVKPEKADPLKQIRSLEKDIEKAKAKNKPVAPGIYAHLGYQYSLIGNKQKAREYLQLERQLYPESSVYIERILKQLG